MATMSSLGFKVAPQLDRSQFTGETVSSTCVASRPVGKSKQSFTVRASATQEHEQQQSRRGVLGLLAASVAAGVLVGVDESRAVTGIKVNGPPPPSGGLPGTENADQPRDLDLPLKERFFIQPLSPSEAVTRIKDASKDIIGVKELIKKKSWPYVRNDLRNKASYLRYDINTILSSKPKDERKEIKKLTNQLWDTMDKLDYAARVKDPKAAEKSYEETIAALESVIAKISA